MKKILHFWIEDYSGTFDDADQLEVDQLGDDEDVQWAAEQYAEHYHSNRDGWKAVGRSLLLLLRQRVSHWVRLA